jgi:hypothetical protein
MAVQTRPENALEENAPRRFSPSQSQRWGAASSLLLFLLVAGTDYADGVAAGEWSELALDTSILAAVVLLVFDTFRKSVLVRSGEIQKVQPLWRNRSVQISEIRRVHVPTTESGLWLYTDPDGNPALKIGAGLEDNEELEKLVIQSAPSEAEITGHRQEERN